MSMLNLKNKTYYFTTSMSETLKAIGVENWKYFCDFKVNNIGQVGIFTHQNRNTSKLFIIVCIDPEEQIRIFPDNTFYLSVLVIDYQNYDDKEIYSVEEYTNSSWNGLESYEIDLEYLDNDNYEFNVTIWLTLTEYFSFDIKTKNKT